MTCCSPDRQLAVPVCEVSQLFLSQEDRWGAISGALRRTLLPRILGRETRGLALVLDLAEVVEERSLQVCYTLLHLDVRDDVGVRMVDQMLQRGSSCQLGNSSLDCRYCWHSVWICEALEV